MTTITELQSTMQGSSLGVIQKKSVPLVHILTSKSGDELEKREEPFNFEKTIKFLSDPHSSHLVDRRIRLCQKMCRQFKNGFIIKDLHYLMKILNKLADLCLSQPNYIESFVEIVTNCVKPFLLDKSTDAEIYSSALVAFYADFGYLLRIPIKRIQQSLLETLYKSIQPSNKSPIAADDYDGMKGATIEYLLRIQCTSDLCETLVKTFSIVENDLSLRVLILKLLQIYSSKSPECVAKMLTHDCVNRLVIKMNDPDPSGELLFRTIELLWNLLENGDEQQISDQLSSRITISLLQEAFLGQVTQGHSQYHRQLRNDILVVCYLIISLKPETPVVETGFAKQLLLYAAFPEVRSSSPIVKNFKLTTSQEDFEFKKLLFNTIVALTRNSAIQELVIESRVLLALLSYIEPLPRRNPTGYVFEWTLAQTEELQLHALAALTILLPIFLNEYFEYHVGTRLLLFYEWTINDDEFRSQGNSFFGKGGRNNKRSQLRYILRLFRSLLSTRDERIQMDLCDQGIIPSITGYLRRITQQKSIQMDNVDLEIICDGLFILSSLCELDVHRKEILGSEGIETLIQLLVIEPQNVAGGLGYHRLLVAVIDCVWCGVVGSVINEDEFIQKQGIFALLDLIEANPKSLQNLVLGCLLDLTENNKSIHFIMAWQGKKQQQFTHLLCELWRDEEREIHVARNEKGVIQDHTKPLMGILQQSVPVTSLRRLEPSRAVLDLIDNMRSKIYGFFCKLGFSELPGLQEEDYVTLCIIENFLDFKMGEIWQEIVTELEIEGVKLVPPDGEAVDTILRATEERGLAVAATQNVILEQYSKHDLKQERDFYEDLIRSHAYKEKRIEQWKAYVERTSKYPLLSAAKDNQIQAVRQSRPEEKEYTGYHTVHNLEIPNVSVTAFTAPFLQIESTPIDLLNKHRQFALTSRRTIIFTLALTIILIVSAAISGLFYNLQDPFPDTDFEKCGSSHETYDIIGSSVLGKYSKSAVAVDNIVCSNIGRHILEKNGTTMDAALAAAICNGVMNAHSMGIGGGCTILIYSKKRNKAYSLVARETAPSAATEAMFIGREQLSMIGGLAIGVPGELRAYEKAYAEFGGGVSWSELFQPTIKLCEEGFSLSASQAAAMRKTRSYILKDPGLSELFVKNKTTNEFYSEGDILKRPKLAKTLRLIAEKGVNEFYTGTLASQIIKEIQDHGGIMKKEDLANYQVDFREALAIHLNDSLTAFTTHAPTSGPILTFILNILRGYEVHSDGLKQASSAALFYHRMIEAFKFAYAKRSELSDPDKVDINQLIENLTSKTYADQIRRKIDDYKTYTYEYYGGTWLDKYKPGTAHLSVVGPDGDAVSLTSTVNLYFGSKVLGMETGIIYNDEMDDFSTPNSTNYFGVPASPANFIAPGKRPVSSMSPLILIENDNQRVQQVLGASGGTKITTSVAQVALLNLWFNENIKEAIDAPRLHSQLLPEEVMAERGFDFRVLRQLKERGHNITCSAYGGSVIQGIEWRDEVNQYWANCDIRKGGAPDGF